MSSAFISVIALLLERFFGYPTALQNRIGHPVQWVGWLIGFCDKHWNRQTATPIERRRAGLISLGAIFFITLALTGLITIVLRTLPFGFLLEAALASTLLASRHLDRSVAAVATGLRQSLSAGRMAVSHIVGRDTKTLDEAEVSRAAIETLAENASDGVIAPLFWLVIFGLPGIALYKTINTADSMIGHLNPQYRDFGWAAAKLDDLVNFIPARLSAVLFAAGAYFVKGANSEAAWATAKTDAKKHASPNAGWPEAAMAGALGFGLGGPRSYNGALLDLPMMGDGRCDLTPTDIDKALTLYRRMADVALAVTFCACLVLLI